MKHHGNFLAYKYIIFLPLRSKVTTISAQNLHRTKSIFTKQIRRYSGKVKQIIIFELFENNSNIIAQKQLTERGERKSLYQ